MSTHYYLAIDLGAESGRVMLGVLTDGRLALRELHRFSNGAVRLGGTLRWDVLRIWEEIKAGLHIAGREGVPVSSLSVDSWALDYVLMREEEPMLRAPFCYRDARTAEPYERLRKDSGEAEIYEQTGIQFMPINTLYHLAAEAREAGALHEMAERFLMIGDWFHFLLTGRPVQEESNASTTQLWDPRARCWSARMMNLAGVPARIFPEVVPPCTKIGALQQAVESETGLRRVEVVAGCVHDTGAAVAAVPAEEGDAWAYLSSGTWSLMGVELPEPLISEKGKRANFTNETGVGGTSRFLRNASGLWILQECKRVWAKEGHDYSYEQLTAEAAAAQPFRSLVDPDDARFLRPTNMPAAVRSFCEETGQPLPETPGEFARCVFESLALLYARTLNLVEDVTGRRITKLHIVGGGSKNDLLNQMTANATGRDVFAGPVEATAIGNVLLQALTLGHVTSHAELRKIVRASFPVSVFHPEKDQPWAAAVNRFGELAD